MNPPATGAILKGFIPPSWFHPVGVLKVLDRLRDRLPDVSGKLFLTFTVDPRLYADEAAAYDHSRDQLRRVFFKLRHGVKHGAKRYVIDAPYCIKTEFHENGWVHYHAIFLTRRFLPGELLTELWGLGRTQVQRIDNDGFAYLLKYVTKADDLPDWVKARNRLRVFQTSRGFLRPPPAKPAADTAPAGEPKKRASYTIAERLDRWARTALLMRGTRVQTLLFQRPFRELFDQLVLPVARAGRYRGNGEIEITNNQEMILWLKQQNQTQR